MSKFTSILLAMLLFAASAFAQSQATTGNIEGRVTDPNGAAVPNATVIATSQDNGLSKTVQSDSEGNYTIVLLPPGTYKVEVPAGQGFAPARYENVKVTVGAKTNVAVTLTVGSSENVVDVSSEGQGVEVTRTSISSTVGENQVKNLPTNGRNFLDFATITPNVVRDP